MDEYQLEIRELRRTLARLQEAEADVQLIDEYEAEVRNLSALYHAAVETLQQGEDDPAMHRALAGLGFGEWTLPNVYSFVYELAMEIPTDGRDMAAAVNELDFAGSLLESVDGGER